MILLHEVLVVKHGSIVVNCADESSESVKVTTAYDAYPVYKPPTTMWFPANLGQPNGTNNVGNDTCHLPSVATRYTCKEGRKEGREGGREEERGDGEGEGERERKRERERERERGRLL